jgi:molecular chaperone DnaK
MTNEALTIGIDLGTTNSLVGTVVERKALLFGDDNRDELLPSVVGVDEAGAVLVGRAAKNRRLLDPSGTVTEIKRKMGTAERVRVGARALSPQQVSALILSTLLDRAERALGTRPLRAIITVPAFFDEAQREATRDAGEIAGLEVERLVNEPTAAALCFETGKEETVLVYDFGGGTFDTSILERDQGLLEVKTSRGDTHLGGGDIDRALVARALQKLGKDRQRVESDPRAMTRLGEALERAKIALSDRDEARVFEPFLAGTGDRAVHLDFVLTLAELDEVAMPFVERTLRSIDLALHDSGLRPRDLDRVLLVGGSSRLRAVERRVSEHLGRPAIVDEAADRLVARGAALLAGRASGLDVDEVLIDITPHTLAAGVADAQFDHDEAPDIVASPIIPRDTVIPVERHATYFTRFEDQEQIVVPILQGEHELAQDNTLLGEVEVKGLPASPAASPVEVCFRLDLSGVLSVTATHVPSGTRAEVEIARSPSRLSEARRIAERAEVAELRELSPAPANDADRKLALALLQRAERALATTDATSEDAARARATVERVTLAVERRSDDLGEAMDALGDALLDLT